MKVMKMVLKMMSLRSTFFYMYNRDKTILYHYTENVQNFSVSLKIHRDTLNKHLRKGTYYLGKYSFSNKLSSSLSVIKFLSVIELNLLLIRDREKYRRKF